MDSSAFNSLAKVEAAALLCLIILGPLGVWKLVEIVIWLFNHITIKIHA